MAARRRLAMKVNNSLLSARPPVRGRGSLLAAMGRRRLEPENVTCWAVKEKSQKEVRSRWVDGWLAEKGGRSRGQTVRHSNALYHNVQAALQES